MTCNLKYQDTSVVEVQNPIFTFVHPDSIEIKQEDLKELYASLGNSVFKKTNFIADYLTLVGVNMVVSIGGEAPHEDITAKTGLWKIEGEGVPENSYFKSIAQSDVLT